MVSFDDKQENRWNHQFGFYVMLNETWSIMIESFLLDWKVWSVTLACSLLYSCSYYWSNVESRSNSSHVNVDICSEQLVAICGIKRLLARFFRFHSLDLKSRSLSLSAARPSSKNKMTSTKSHHFFQECVYLCHALRITPTNRCALTSKLFSNLQQ